MRDGAHGYHPAHGTLSGLLSVAESELESQGRHMGGCQNYGPFLSTLNVRCRTILGTQKGTIILTTTYINK